jgi:ATP sulfurylase
LRGLMSLLSGFGPAVVGREHANSPESYDPARATELWQVSEQLVRKVTG